MVSMPSVGRSSFLRSMRNPNRTLGYRVNALNRAILISTEKAHVERSTERSVSMPSIGQFPFLRPIRDYYK